MTQRLNDKIKGISIGLDKTTQTAHCCIFLDTLS